MSALTEPTKELTRELIELHVAICKRYEQLQNLHQLESRGVTYRTPFGSRVDRMMDLEAVDQELDMDWQALLDAKDGDFLHDVVGIHNHMDRSTALLADCFLPRYARAQEPDQLTDDDGSEYGGVDYCRTK